MRCAISEVGRQPLYGKPDTHVHMERYPTIYSYRRASIGLRREARRAGYTPKKSPVAQAKKTAMPMDSGETIVRFHVAPTITEASRPKATPVSAPSRLISTASV